MLCIYAIYHTYICLANKCLAYSIYARRIYALHMCKECMCHGFPMNSRRHVLVVSGLLERSWGVLGSLWGVLAVALGCPWVDLWQFCDSRVFECPFWLMLASFLGSGGSLGYHFGSFWNSSNAAHPKVLMRHQTQSKTKQTFSACTSNAQTNKVPGPDAFSPVPPRQRC